MKLVSWNVNGLRSILTKGLHDFLATEQPDILCLQETRCDVSHLLPGAFGDSYECHLNCAEKKGYSGTGIFTRISPVGVTCGMGKPEHDTEGRVLTVELPEFHLVNVYVPNSKRELSRLPYRQQWDADFLRYLKGLESTKPVVVCGDFNVAHRPIDLARPADNPRTHGFTAEERAGFDAFLAAGFIDTFREFESAGGHYTWWSTMRGVRARNIGWRIDYFLVSAALRPRLREAFIRPNVMGSDHCPVGVIMD